LGAITNTDDTEAVVLNLVMPIGCRMAAVSPHAALKLTLN
jgi:hypothetical protein